jgi:formate hydrogenlyase subunit 6/NADH:ubiquinone oxidoreductase subunit I
MKNRKQPIRNNGEQNSFMKAYFQNIFEAVRSILIGMKVTWRHLFTKPVTLQYPHEKLDYPERTRGMLFCKIEDCIGCLQCARACPVNCIYIDAPKAPKEVDLGVTSDGTKKRLYVTQFDIDMTLCCYCGLCTEPCPTECLIMTEAYEYTVYDRSDLLLRFAKKGVSY